jgi:hypothetical protein
MFCKGDTENHRIDSSQFMIQTKDLSDTKQEC